jgi:hypothetical protein
MGREDTQGDKANADWRQAITKHLSNPGSTRDKKVHQQALECVLMDDELYRHTVDGVLLKCLGKEQSQVGRYMKACAGHIRRHQK